MTDSDKLDLLLTRMNALERLLVILLDAIKDEDEEQKVGMDGLPLPAARPEGIPL